METKTTADGNTPIIEVDQKKSSWKEKFGRKTSLVFGILGIIFPVILGITIIGLLFAIPLFLFSIGLIYAAFEKQEVQCPNCNHKRRIRKVEEENKQLRNQLKVAYADVYQRI
ncbi:hypothetical protein PDQ36_23715 [Bacillus cereus]|nr:hypothetical protein [Bacillus cereus]